jgi:hypothetical protein
MKFIHRFSRSLSCEMTVADEPPLGGEFHIRNVAWTGRPKPKHVREYVRWIHVVNEHLANLWGFKLMHAVQVEPRLWELWGYEPGKPAKLLDKMRGS